MTNLLGKALNKIADWLDTRSLRKYERIISQYSEEEQESIRRGREVLLYRCSRQEFEKKTGTETHVVLVEKGVCSYEIVGFFEAILPDREGNVERWKRLGKLGVDVLVDAESVGPDGFQIVIGRPLRVVVSNEKFDALRKAERNYLRQFAGSCSTT